MRAKIMILLAIVCSLAVLAVPAVQEANAQEAQPDEIGRTPPRLSFAEGRTSFWRPGADEWVQAQINTALAPGDQLYVEGEGNLELQIGARAFIRSGPNSQIGLESLEPDFLQFRVTTGSTALDLREMTSGQMVAVETPHAAFKFDTEGYFRLDVDDEQTILSTHRAGRATLITPGGEAIPIGSNTSVTIEGTENPNITSQTALRLDDWDHWNHDRTDQVLNAESARYVSSEVYGLSDLDRHGTWRIVPTYGPVWMPRGVAAGWVPYSTGAWVRDPYYGWTWVDTAPWGWAPYHYGRWVYVSSYWCWAPGPRIVRPVYAPALVAFFGAPGVQIGIGIGSASVGWVSLGWGEPLIPWWGRPGFIHRPWWGGWAGPRYVNNRIVHRRTVVNVQHINTYRNARVKNGLVAVHRRHFGRGPIANTHRVKADAQHMRPMHAAPQVTASAAGFVPTRDRGKRPPEKYLKRSVVTYRRTPSAATPAVGTTPRRDARNDRITTHRPMPATRRPNALPMRPSPTVGGNHIPDKGAKVDRPRTPRVETPKNSRKPLQHPVDSPVVRPAPPQPQRTPQAPAPRVAPPPQSPKFRSPMEKKGPQDAEPRPDSPQSRRQPDPVRPRRSIERTPERSAPPPVIAPESPDRGSSPARRPFNNRIGGEGEQSAPERGRPEPYQREERQPTEQREYRPGASTPNDAAPRQGRGAWRGSPENHPFRR